jgi:cytidine deaminase
MAKRDSHGKIRARLTAAARRALRNAHAPYSKFKVGAALLTTTGEIFLGCNVENASYGMTNCAERTAIFTAVAELGPKMEIRAIAVANNHNAPCSPCGACRQVIYEFGPKAVVYFRGKSGQDAELPIADLLPEGFRLQ